MVLITLNGRLNICFKENTGSGIHKDERYPRSKKGPFGRALSSASVTDKTHKGAKLNPFIKREFGHLLSQTKEEGFDYFAGSPENRF